MLRGIRQVLFEISLSRYVTTLQLRTKDNKDSKDIKDGREQQEVGLVVA
jgi:hypothetical protein